jgi:hypothetical protein
VIAVGLSNITDDVFWVESNPSVNMQRVRTRAYVGQTCCEHESILAAVQRLSNALDIPARRGKTAFIEEQLRQYNEKLGFLFGVSGYSWCLHPLSPVAYYHPLSPVAYYFWANMLPREQNDEQPHPQQQPSLVGETLSPVPNTALSAPCDAMLMRPTDEDTARAQAAMANIHSSPDVLTKPIEAEGEVAETRRIVFEGLVREAFIYQSRKNGWDLNLSRTSRGKFASDRVEGRFKGFLNACELYVEDPTFLSKFLDG